MFRSIRWRLTLSFAAIALLAAFALGAVLIAIVQNYYSQLELAYLQSNAKSISATLTKIMNSGLPVDTIQSQVENLAFLSQTRVRVLGENNNVLYDAGLPQKVSIAVGLAKQRITVENGAGGQSSGEYTRIISIGDIATRTITTTDRFTDTGLLAKDQTLILFRAMPAVGTPFGFDLDAEMALTGARSNQVVREPLVDANGKPQGTVELSAGPSLGRDIVRNVALGWAFASLIAVVFAAGVGWFISRRISAPVLALTNATAQMANGDLSSRANISSRDEFGTLAHSFNEMADQVESTVNALRQFASDAAHELNSPLTALRTDLDLALAEESPRAMIERAQATVKRLEELNRNLLDLSRLEASHNNKDAEPIDLTDVVRQLGEVYASQAEQAEITFQIELPDAPIIINADAMQIQRAVGNLIENALKFTPSKGTVRVHVSHDKDATMISVSDTGIGIPADDLPKLFNRFHRGRNATAFAGSGLGLTIVKAIAEQSGAEASAENLAQGARFTLRWQSGHFP